MTTTTMKTTVTVKTNTTMTVVSQEATTMRSPVPGTVQIMAMTLSTEIHQATPEAPVVAVVAVAAVTAAMTITAAATWAAMSDLIRLVPLAPRTAAGLAVEVEVTHLYVVGIARVFRLV